MNTRMLRALCACLLPCLFACGTLEKGMRKAGVKNPLGKEGRRAAATVESLADTFAELTPEQEYFIGRAVAAEVLAGTDVIEDDLAHDYLNRLGVTLAQASERPEVFGGYHFFILDSDEENALAAPGAFVFITRGLLRRCESEEELAAVVAHEIVHVVEGHGLKMVQKSQRTDLLLKIGLAEAMRANDVAKLRRALDAIAKEFVGTLVKHGYSRSYERAADEGAVALMAAAGYQTSALADLLGRMATQQGGDAALGTHDDLAERQKAAARAAARQPGGTATAARKNRFARALAGARS